MVFSFLLNTNVYARGFLGRGELRKLVSQREKFLGYPAAHSGSARWYLELSLKQDKGFHCLLIP